MSEKNTSAGLNTIVAIQQSSPYKDQGICLGL